MTLKEYCLAVAEELPKLPPPDDIDYNEVARFVRDLWERNIEPSIAAEFVINKFGVKQESNNKLN